jgi:hypothetical protein
MREFYGLNTEKAQKLSNAFMKSVGSSQSQKESLSFDRPLS